ncbi:MAG: hypothetical protein Q7S74_06120 [Nanoarchaeota archaeon]|nr:hypothetical protein [Nanoarchaeota archaeon]
MSLILMMKKEELKSAFLALAILVIIGIPIMLAVISVRTIAQSSTFNQSANLTIKDNSFSDSGSNKFSNFNVTFTANYTNSTGSTINLSNGNGLCQIQFNFTGSYTAASNMTYNVTSYLWEYNRTFNYKGTHQFKVNCTSNFGNITLVDQFEIANTLPSLKNLDQRGFLDLDGNLFNNDYFNCNEDTPCTYNFSANVTEPDVNDILAFNYSSASNTTLTNFTFNSLTGVLAINVTNEANTGEKQIELNVRDTESPTVSGILSINITKINDAPQFVGLTNKTFNSSILFSYLVNVSDQENNTPFKLNITFISCNTAEWSDRNSTNCILFNSSYYNFNNITGILNITFTPAFNDIGSYIINFTVSDSGTTSPVNASITNIINFTVITPNNVPYFRYVCDNERNATENSLFNCYINATDTDETNNITFTSNETWFTFNRTGTSTVSIATNASTKFNASALVNFTAKDAQVGNWSIKITLNDTGNPQQSNSTEFYFFVANVNDSVNLLPINNITVYTSNNYTIFINATDDDILIPDKRVYNESLTFTSNNSKLNISIFQIIAGTNITTANISFNPNDLNIGNNTINITVRDVNNFSLSSRLFNINVISNIPPQWNSSTKNNITLTEGTAFYLNLTQNVTDSEGQRMNFSYISDTSFPSFQLNSTTGIINFTPLNIDVGQHILIINATDGVTPSSLTFNFTVLNVNDLPVIRRPLSADNLTVNSTNSNMNTSEDSATEIQIYIEDEDLRIPVSQRGFYNENINITVNISGKNTQLFTFDGGQFALGNATLFKAAFTPNKSSVGNYNITINITDASNRTDEIKFNLTISAIEHTPVLSKITNNTLSSILEPFYVDFNVTDIEDGSEPPVNSNFTYLITNLTTSGNFLTINSTTGVINFTLNKTYAGKWIFNVTVNDTSGLKDYQVFNLTVYDYPVIILPSLNTNLSLKENVSSQLNFTVNHTVQDTLNYTLYIRGESRNITLGNGNATPFLWFFTPNFTEEITCTGYVSLTLNVSNAKLSNSTTWNLTINRTNYPISFTSQIGGSDKLLSGGSSLQATLSNYFQDFDASDSCTNQTVIFNYTSFTNTTTISASLTNWINASTPTITFSTSTSDRANYSITAYEYNESNSSQLLSNVSSNNFTVDLTVSTTTSTTGGGGGGGGQSQIKPISLKIIVPAPVTSRVKDKLILPVSVVNDGEVDLNQIVLDSIITKNGIIRKDIIATFDRSFITKLPKGTTENLTLIIDVNAKEIGLYEITLNATVKDPSYHDWGKLYIDIREEEGISERIKFTEELVVGNPECTEIKEIVDEAKILFAKGDIESTKKKLDEAVKACAEAIAQPSILRSPLRLQNNAFSYAAIGSLAAIVLGIAYYIYKRRRFKSQYGF